MKKAYTVRFAHLAKAPDLKIGQVINRHEIIGEMGNTGQSTGPHVHIDAVKGIQTNVYRQADIEAGKPEAAPRQAAYFIDFELFDAPFKITSYFADPKYLERFGKCHMGFDVIPDVWLPRSWIHWNRSMPGRVMAIINDPNGYGNCLYIAFDA